MRRSISVSLRVVALALAALFVMATAASAAAPKFHSATSSVDSAGRLTVAFDERGLGNENITYTVTATANASWACINGGGKNPSAANKRSIVGQVSASATFQPKNGRVVASVTTAAPSPGTFACPSGQRLVLAGVSYSNIVLTDTTNGVSTAVPSASRTFFNV